jgi:hypothetical protein
MAEMPERYRATTAGPVPSSATRPDSSSTARVQRRWIASRLWLTKSTVLPAWATSPILPMHFRWKAASPTASTSSTTRISASRCAATANASRMYMPLE